MASWVDENWMREAIENTLGAEPDMPDDCLRGGIDWKAFTDRRRTLVPPFEKLVKLAEVDLSDVPPMKSGDCLVVAWTLTTTNGIVGQGVLNGYSPGNTTTIGAKPIMVVQTPALPIPTADYPPASSDHDPLGVGAIGPHARARLARNGAGDRAFVVHLSRALAGDAPSTSDAVLRLIRDCLAVQPVKGLAAADVDVSLVGMDDAVIRYLVERH